MTIARFDHVAIPAGDPEALLAFYTALGFEPVGAEAWRAGDVPFFALAFGDAKINVHAPELWQNPRFTLRAPHAHPGSADLCFAWEGSLDALRGMLERAGAGIEDGPVERAGGRGGGRDMGTSLYTRDPDGNLLEFIVYDERAASNR